MTTATPDPAIAPLPPTGVFANGEHMFPIRIYFEDTDAGGVVYHSNYLSFMERARSDMLQLLEIDQRSALEAGEGVYAVTSVKLDYVAPAKLGDALVIYSRVREIRGASCTIDQLIKRGDQLVVRGSVTVAYISPAGRPKRQPPEWVAAFQRVANLGNADR